MAARLLKVGLQGTDVQELQTSLKKVGYSKLGVDGKFGRETLSAVGNFQSWWGLGVDGIVGPKTREAIQQAVKGGQPKKPGSGKASKSASRSADTKTTGGDPGYWIVEEWYIFELADDFDYEDWAEYELYAEGWEDLEDDDADEADDEADDDADDADDEADEADDEADDDADDKDDADDEADDKDDADDEADDKDDADDEADDKDDADDATDEGAADEGDDAADEGDDAADEGGDDAADEGGDEGGGDEGGGDEGGGGGGDEDE